MTIARRIYANPAAPDERMILWSDGRIESRGGAPIIGQVEASVNQSNGTNAPLFRTWPQPDQAVALAVLDWDTPKGYTLTHYGHVWAWGGAPVVPGGPEGNFFLTTGPEYFWGYNGGFGSPVYGYVIDFVMDPSINGLGYFVQYDGNVIGFGTGVPSIAHFSGAVSPATARMLLMDWSSKRYWVLDTWGRMRPFNGANAGTTVGTHGLGSIYEDIDDPGYIWGRGGGGAAARLYSKAATPAGWTSDIFGRVYAVEAAIPAYGWPFDPASPTFRDLEIISDGTGDDPLRLVLLRDNGSTFEWTVSSPPTVTVIEPTESSTITTTTRPYVRWTYSDSENNPQGAYVVSVFTDAQYGIGGFDVLTSPATFRVQGTDHAVREVQIGVDLANDTYRAYVSVIDTSIQADTDYNQWTQNVTPPSTPTVSATDSSGVDGISLALHVSTSGLDPDARFGVQYHDSDWDGETWEWVRDGYDVTPDASGDATVVDGEARFGIVRTYRAVVYVYDEDTDVWLASAWSTSDTATLTPSTVWAFTDPLDSSLDLIVEPEEGLVQQSRGYTNGVFFPVGRDDPVIVSDGGPKFAQIGFSLWAITSSQRTGIQAILDSEGIVLIRDPLGRAWYFRAASMSMSTSHQASGSRTDEVHSYQISGQTVRRPLAGPTTGPYAGT